jgi:protein-disulfide isomerase
MNDASQIDEHDHVRGPRDAQVVIVEYGDFQCPYTARAAAALVDLQERLGGGLCVVFRHFPLPEHPYAELAAEAAEAAGAQRKFWQMHDALFANQGKISAENLPVFAESIELDIDRFRDQMLARHYRPRVLGDAVRGRRGGVKGTPTFFINGEHFHGDSDELSLAGGIEQALLRSGTVPPGGPKEQGSGRWPRVYR